MKAMIETRIVPALAWAWWHVLAVVRMLWICRAAVLPVAVGFGLIVGTDQARDIVVANAAISRHNVGSLVAILVAVTTWSTVAWYWARVTVQYAPINPVPPPPRDAWHAALSAEVPRLIGTAGMLSVALAFRQAAKLHAIAGDIDNADNFRGAMWMYVALAGLFYIAVRNRGPIARWLVARGMVGPGWLPDRSPSNEILDARHGFARRFLVLTLLATPLFYGLVVAFPVWMSDHVFRGAVPAALLGFALMVPVGSYLAMLSARSGFPFFGAALVALVASPIAFGDFHDVRTIRSADLACDQQDKAWLEKDHARRKLLKDTYFDWWQRNVALVEPAAGPHRAPPMVMVATAGGASRAAFWTTQVLGEIAAREPYFSDRLFMISGVSGGSLGAVTFRSLVEANRRGKTESPTLPTAPRDAGDIITNDFLGPTFAAGLYVDLPSNGLTVLPRRWLPGDRAVALEKAWEAAWQNSPAGKAAGFTWDQGFVETFGGPRPWPLLVLNGTSVEKGKRILTSNVRFSSESNRQASMSGDINRYDTFDITRADIPISTSVTMSARFPVISPTGALRDCTGTAHARVTDGGLFENFGAATLDEALRYLTMRIGAVQDGRKNGQFQAVPLAIVISSDPSLDQLYLREDGRKVNTPPDCAPVRGDDSPAPRPHRGNGRDECPAPVKDSARLLVDPVQALYDGRVARGELAATALSDRLNDARLVVRERLAELLVGEKHHADATPRTPRQIETDGNAALDEVSRRIGTSDHSDFFHFRQCKLRGQAGPTMSWHDSEAAWKALRDMLGLAQGSGDECGNAAEFFRLCMRLTSIAEGKSDSDATDACVAKNWPRPAKWDCPQVRKGRCGLRRE